MGKYMKKSKLTGDVAVMEVSTQSTIGVRTRAKTLALQRLQTTANKTLSSRASSAVAAQDPDASSSLCYLQLRNRRLEKCLPPIPTKKKDCRNPNPNPNSNSKKKIEEGNVENKSEAVEEVEASFGENDFDSEARDRSTRESTPCSFVRGPDAMGTPVSTTRRPTSATTTTRAQHGASPMPIPPDELEEFFSAAEEDSQRLYFEKYNFDFVNDAPLPGRYEWVRVTP